MTITISEEERELLIKSIRTRIDLLVEATRYNDGDVEGWEDDRIKLLYEALGQIVVYHDMLKKFGEPIKAERI